jgi:uncharacterized phage protein (TIGR01671 family)
MRKIKFRALTEQTQGWFYWELLDMIGPNDIREDIRKETVGEFTGLKDKNGKEIFEGDIVKGRFVEANVSDAMWLTLTEQEKYQGFRLFTINTIFEPYQVYMPDDMEVIGNIWEHPHLLEDN